MYPYRRARALAAGRMRTEALRPWVHAARLDVYFQFAAALYSGAGPKYGFSDESKPGQGNARPRPRGVFNLLYSSNRHSSPQHPQPHVYTHMTQSLFQSRAVVGVEDQTDTSVQRAHRKQKRLSATTDPLQTRNSIKGVLSPRTQLFLRTCPARPIVTSSHMMSGHHPAPLCGWLGASVT